MNEQRSADELLDDLRTHAEYERIEGTPHYFRAGELLLRAAAEIERLRRELETQVYREKHAKCLRCGHGLFETTLPEAS